MKSHYLFFMVLLCFGPFLVSVNAEDYIGMRWMGSETQADLVFNAPMTEDGNDDTSNALTFFYERSSHFSWVDANGVLRYGRPSGTQLWVNSDPAPTLGDEIVVNGDFATGDLTGFTDVNDYWEVVDGKAYHASSNVFNCLMVDLGVDAPGKTILIELDVSDYTPNAGLRLQFRQSASTPVNTNAPFQGDGSISLNPQITANGHYSCVATIPANARYIGFSRDYSGYWSGFSIDNISIREYTAPASIVLSEAYAIPYDWGISPNGYALENAVVLGDDSVVRYVQYADGSLTAGTYLFSVYVKVEDNSTPSSGAGSSHNIEMEIDTSGPVLEDIVQKSLGNGIYRLSAIRHVPGTGNDTIRVRKNTSNDSKTVYVSGFQCEELPSDNALGDEQSSGTLTIGNAYQITATQTDHFYTGCAVDDIFVAEAETALDANNKVKTVPAWVVEHSTYGPVISSGTLTDTTPYLVVTTETDHFGTGVVVGDVFVSDGTETCDANNTVKEIKDPSIQPSPYVETTDATATLPATVPIEANGFPFQGSAVLNLIDYSQDFSQWNKSSGATLSVANVLGPDNQSTSYLFEGDGTINEYVTRSTTNLADATDFSASIWVKSAGDTFDNDDDALVALHGDVSDTSTYNLGNLLNSNSGWVRVDIAEVTTDQAAADVNFTIRCDVDAGFYIFGAQLTEGPMLHRYIPTNGTPAVVMPTENVRWTLSDKLKGILGAQTGEGALIFEFYHGIDSADRPLEHQGIISVRDSVGSILYNHSAAGHHFAAYDGTNACLLNTLSTYDAEDKLIFGVRFTAEGNELQAGAYQDGDWVWKNAAAFDGSFTLNDYLSIGYSNSTNFHINNIRLYSKQGGLSTSEIEAIVASDY